MLVVLSGQDRGWGLQASPRVQGVARRRRSGRPWVLGLAGLLSLHCGQPLGEKGSEPTSQKQGLSVTLTDCQPASLAQAIGTANAAGAGPHTIALMGGCTYSLTSRDNYWYGPNGLPPIQSELTIDGGAQGAIIERAMALDTPTFRLFYVAGLALPPRQAGQLTLHNLTLRGGLAQGGSSADNQLRGGAGMGAGGAIFAHGSVTLNAVTVLNNVAVGGNSGGQKTGGDWGAWAATRRGMAAAAFKAPRATMAVAA